MRSKLINKSVRTPLRAALLAGATALAFAVVGGVAQADVSYTLNNANSGLGGAIGPFGTVTLTDGTGTGSGGNNIAIGTVQVLESLSSNYTANTGVSTGQFEFNLSSTLTGLSASPITFSDVTSSTPLTSGGTLVTSTKPSNTTVGSFDWAIVCTSCGNGASPPQYHTLTFDLTANGGLSASDFMQNAASVYFLADIYDSTTGKTGYVWTDKPNNPVGPPVPEPGSLALLGTGLIGLGFAVRRRRRRS